MENSKFKQLLSLWAIASLGLFLYSFTQIDLNLTLSRISIWQAVQKKFMYIGYFNRPLSTEIYIFLVLILFLLYLFSLVLAYKNKISIGQIWIIIGVISTVLFLSYPAFSHDIFNYMFSAKLIVKYNANPYYVKPLDFPADPWINFMRWTHRPAAYPPLWIILTLPSYILGFNFIIPIILNFKALSIAAYFGSSYLLYKIMEAINYRHKEAAVVFFALNPLVIIESLVSAHNDTVMIFWALLGFYILQKQNKILGLFNIAVSAATKVATISLLPLVIIGPRRLAAFLFMLLSLLIYTSRLEILPWHFLWVLPFAALNIDRKLIVFPSIGLSLGLLLRYTPFLYLGNWDPPVPTIKFWVTIVPVILSVMILIVCFTWRFKIQDSGIRNIHKS
jgi:hypothetical protein